MNLSYSYADEIPGFWEEAKANNYKKGNLKTDCDTRSKQMYLDFIELFGGRILPNGEVLDLNYKRKGVMEFRNYRLTGDNIFTRFSGRNKTLINQLEEYTNSEQPNGWEIYQQNLIRAGWVASGEVFFPRRRGSINVCRGFSRAIMDRFDSTLECIRLHYEGKDNPLSCALQADQEWFDLFVSFKEYVDFFYLNDWVDENYSVINQLREGEPFFDVPLPQNLEEMMRWHENMLRMISLRNKRLLSVLENKE